MSFGSGGGGGGGGNGNDATYFENIRNDELNAQRAREKDRENEERDIRTKEADQARHAENVRQAKIRSSEADITGRFDSMFTPDFYAKREADYRGYYKPQLDDQFKDSQKQLTYWLADRGTLDSSIRGDKTADLQKVYDSGMREINNKALDLTAHTKGDVANTRANLIGDARNANSPDDPTISSTMTALSTPQTSYAPPVYSSGTGGNAFADMFGTFTNVLGKQAAFERSAAYGGPQPTFNTGLFGNTNSVRNIA